MLSTQTPAPIGPGDNFKDVAIGVVKIDAAPIVPPINLCWNSVKRIGPIGQLACSDSAQNVVKLSFTDKKGKMTGNDGLISLKHIERRLAHLQHGEVPESTGRRQVENVGVEGSGCDRIRCMNDRVIQSHRHLWIIAQRRLRWEGD